MKASNETEDETKNEAADDAGALAERERVERVLGARFREPSLLPPRLPSPRLLESVRLEAHRQIQFAAGTTFRARRIRDLALAALMAGVTAVYMGWALTSVADLYR